MRRPILALLVAGLLLTAGCISTSPSAFTAGDTDDDATDDPSVAESIEVVELHVDAPPDEERIVLENAGDAPLELGGWTIRDGEGGQIDRGMSPLRFPDGFTLEPGERVTIWTGEGENTETDLYWDYGVNIWNQGGDVVVLVSPDGERAFEHAYGDAEVSETNDGSDAPADDEGASDGGDDTDDGDDETGETDETDETNESDADADDAEETAATPEGELEIHHIDVGQADSTLIVTPDGETILVDTGDWQRDGEEVIAYLEERGVDRIDHLVATHAHADHVGGHAAVIEHFETEGEGIGAAYDSGVVAGSATYERYLDAIETHDVDLFVVEGGDELPIDDEQVEAIVRNPPAGESGTDGDLNDNSVALSIEFGEFTYLTTGDAEGQMERRMVEEWGDDLEADVYQVGHHGSSTSSTAPFLDAVDPEIAIVSSAYDSTYGHPHDEVLASFADRGIETYWTGVHGTVVLTTDGREVEVEPERAAPTDPAALLEEKPEGEETNEYSIGATVRSEPLAVAPVAR